MHVEFAPQTARESGAIPGLAFDDPAGSLIAMVLRLVSVSHWRFGRLRGSERLVGFACPGTEPLEAEQERFLAECRMQRRRGSPRLGLVTPGRETDYPYGVVLTLADPGADFSMLELFRDANAGPFSVNELGLLAFAVESSHDVLLPEVQESAATDALPALQRREMPLLVILDRDYKVVMGRRVSVGTDVEANRAIAGERLPQIIEDAVRRLTAGWADDPSAHFDGVAMPLPFLALRTQTLSSGETSYVAVTLERVRGRNVLYRASRLYTITQRECEVLALLLDGMRIDEIAERLGIAASTVSDHVKSLIARTHSTNRSQMLARILGWDRAHAFDGSGATESR